MACSRHKDHLIRRQCRACQRPGHLLADLAGLFSEAVANAEPGQRLRTIGQHQRVWAKAKIFMTRLSCDKCWYCEHKPVRNPLSVDHFRPKARPSERGDHPGYWWLAFELSNYRLACTFCNSPHAGAEATVGKRNHFPILDEADRAMSENESIAKEFPMLLDPIRQSDGELLWFRQDGDVAFRNVDAPPTDIDRQRAEMSIDIYDLNGIKLREARRDRMREVRDLVEDADDCLIRRAVHGPDASIDERLASRMNRIFELIDGCQEYSIASLHVLLALRDSPSADTILNGLAEMS